MTVALDLPIGLTSPSLIRRMPRRHGRHGGAELADVGEVVIEEADIIGRQRPGSTCR
jgi:hypothetical protein